MGSSFDAPIGVNLSPIIKAVEVREYIKEKPEGNYCTDAVNNINKDIHASLLL